MNSLFVLFSSVITFILIKGLNSYGPGTQDTTVPPNTTWLSSSEEEKIHFSQVEHVVNKFTLPGTVESVLLNHTIIDPKGYKDRLELFRRFYRGRRHKFWNNKTKKWERYNQRLARVNEAIMDEIFAKKNAVNLSDEFKFHESLAERKFAKQIDWYPEAHDVDIYEPDYSGDKIKDDYEVKRKKRGVNELDDNVSSHQKEMKNEMIVDTFTNDKLILNIQIKEEIPKGGREFRGHRGDISSGIRMNTRKVQIKSRRIKRSIGSPKFTYNNLLKSLKYLALRHKLANSFYVKHDRDKRSVSGDEPDVPPGRRELYKDYKSDWPYAKYDSNIHYDQIVEMPQRRPHSMNYSKLHTPDSSVMNSFYNDDQKNKDYDRIKLKNLYRSMEYWTFTDPMNKYTSSSTKKYDKPRPTFGRNAATISVGASRFKLFNRNWYNEYKHRVHKRDTFGFSHTGGFIDSLVNYASKIVDIYNTVATVYFKSIYGYMANMYYQSYLGNTTNQVNMLEDPDYADAVDRMGYLSGKFSNWSSNLSNTIFEEGTETVTQYIYLNWYTEKYRDNSTQYFCDYANDTYKFVNGRLKLYNKTSHQLAIVEDVGNVTGSFITNDSIILDRRTKEPPKLLHISSEEAKKLHLNTSADGDVYTVVNNMSNPGDNYQMSLRDLYGQPKPPVLPTINVTVAAETSTLVLNSNEEIVNNNRTSFQLKTPEDLFRRDVPNGINQSNQEYPDDILDKAADFVLSFFINNSKTAMETTTDDYTEMTNDLFDKIERKAIDIMNGMSTTINSDTISTAIDLATESSSVTTSVNLTSIPTISTFELQAGLINKTLRNLTLTKITTFEDEQKNIKVNNSRIIGLKTSTGSFKRPVQIKNQENISPKSYSKIRAKRSLASRCLKGIQFVGQIFRPAEKQIKKVLNGIFGPYSSNEGSNSDEKKSLRHGKKSTYSDEKILRTHFESAGSSLKEDKSFSRFRNDGGNVKSASEDSHKSKENHIAIKPDITLDISATSNHEISTKRSKHKKKKHKRKHTTFDNLFEEKNGQKSEGQIENDHEKTMDKTEDDQPLPSFIKNPTFETQPQITVSTNFPHDTESQNPNERNQPFGSQMGNNTFQDYNDPRNLNGRNQPFGNQMGNITYPDYNDPQNPYGRDRSFGNTMGNNTFPDYQDPQNLKGKNQPFGNQLANDTFQDYNDPQNPYGKNQPFGNQVGKNTFPDYQDPQNPYGKNQPFGNQNNTFPDYNDPQNPYGGNQALKNSMGNNTFQEYNDLQNPYGRINEPFGNQMGNNTFPNYNGPQNAYGRNQPFGNQVGNNTFQDYQDTQNLYGRNQAFENPMGNNTFQDYNDPQNMYGRDQPFGNAMGNKTFPDYNDPQNLYGRNQPYGNKVGNNTFQDYNDVQDPYGKNQPFVNQMGNNTFQDYNDPQNLYYGRNQALGPDTGNNTFPDYNDPQNLYGKNQPFANQMGNNTFQDYNDPGRNLPFGSPKGNDTFQDYNDPQNIYGPNQQAFGNQMGGSNNLQNYNNPQNSNGNNQAYGNQNVHGNLPGQGSAMIGTNQNIPAPLNSPGSPHQVIVTTSYISTAVKELVLQVSKNNVANITDAQEVTETLGPTQNLGEILGDDSFHNSSVTTSDVKYTTNRLLDTKSTLNPTSTFETTLGLTKINFETISFANISKNGGVHLDGDESVSSTCTNPNINVQAETKGKANLVFSSSKAGATDSFRLLTTGPTSETTPLWIDEWLDNKITFNTNIFENVSSKPVLDNGNGEHFGAIENNTKITSCPLVTSCISSTNPNEQLKSESEDLLTTAAASKTKTTSTKFETNDNFTAGVEKMIKSTSSHLEMDKQKLEDLLSSIYISNKSALNIKTALERLLLHTEDNLTTIITTSASSPKEAISISSAATRMQNIPDVLTVNISGSPYILMKKDLLKLNSGSENVQNELLNAQNMVGMNPFAQGIQESPNILNPFQNVMNPIIPQQNLYDPYANNLPPQPNPFMIPNNVQGQDYQMPFLNPVQELNKSFSLDHYRQVYPSFVQPQIPMPPFPPVYLTQPNVQVPGI